ncbi:hypothetical protein EVAR_93284_1 [Eumeta japonica]|uniref:CAP-Gly domain-containing protein n=1 Tax=Eumeta variegata TaxID=151549 RepID=A0A4C1UTY4_EUMVA|nr:hypothetical protein EVAR_93284_1 [Eumeta japonica]
MDSGRLEEVPSGLVHLDTVSGFEIVNAQEIIDCNKKVDIDNTNKINENSETEYATSIDESEQIKFVADTTFEEPTSQISNFPKQSETSQTSFKTKLELLSKFDVRIKVKTVREGTLASDTTSETESTIDEKNHSQNQCKIKKEFNIEEEIEHYKDVKKGNREEFNRKTISSENIKMAVPNEAEAKSKCDKFDVQVRITSEDSLVVKETVDRPRRGDTLNLDVDDLSLRSMSEGDNSVFSEGVTTPMAPGDAARGQEDKTYEQENISGNESEEVDDIELIFTTDESKDISNLQEDLVSIRDSDHWGSSPTSTPHSTPVLIKFHTLDPDFQPGGEPTDGNENENQENMNLQNVIADSSLKTKRVSLPNDKEIRHVAFNGKNLDLPNKPGILKSSENKSDNMLYRKSPNTSTRRLDSVDSLTCEYTRGLSFDNTKSSSFELGSSMDILHREDSVDSFNLHSQALGHRFSVFAETDISKCGISEDDLATVNLSARRNTCPNPFQYRPAGYRNLPRPVGPFRATLTSAVGRTRPILRTDTSAVRRENGAQTEVSALPNRWSSDGYLAHKMGITPMAALPTLPSRGTVHTLRRLPVPETRTNRNTLAPVQRRTDDARRVMLSDISFTSMVPELSRSADPLWAGQTAGRRAACSTCGATPEPPPTTSTAKFLSRGSSYRSPCASVDKGSDWMPQTSFNSPKKGCRVWRSSLPDVRGDDTDELIEEAETFLRRSIDNLRNTFRDSESDLGQLNRPYIPGEPRHLRLGHAVKLITPQGRIAVGKVRYVGLAGSTAADSCVMVGAIVPLSSNPGLPLNDGTHRGRRYFHAPPHHTALFVPFSKVVMAWAN